MKEQATAYELYLDNELLARKGIVDTNKKKATPGYGTNTIFFETDKPTINLILVVSNFHHRNGGIWSVPKLPNSSYARSVYGRSNACAINTKYPL